jgi:hypothetical protein
MIALLRMQMTLSKSCDISMSILLLCDIKNTSRWDSGIPVIQLLIIIHVIRIPISFFYLAQYPNVVVITITMCLARQLGDIVRLRGQEHISPKFGWPNTQSRISKFPHKLCEIYKDHSNNIPLQMMFDDNQYISSSVKSLDILMVKGLVHMIST